MIEVTLSPVRFQAAEFVDVEIKLTNTGPGAYSNVIFTIKLPPGITRLRGQVRTRIAYIRPGESSTWSLTIRADSAGQYELTTSNFSYQDHQGRPHRSDGDVAVITVDPRRDPVPDVTTGRQETPRGSRPSREEAKPKASAAPTQAITRVLLLAASPRDMQRLRIDKEACEIQRVLEEGRHAGSFEITAHLRVRAEDISGALLQSQPRIVHLAGHGDALDGSFVAENEYEFSQVIAVDALVRLFRMADPLVHCVIVNACATQVLAERLSQIIPLVVGMRRPVGDGSAIRFSVGFYQALAAGRSLEDAYDFGCNLLRMAQPGDDHLVPVLFRHGKEQ